MAVSRDTRCSGRVMKPGSVSASGEGSLESIAFTMRSMALDVRPAFFMRSVVE